MFVLFVMCSISPLSANPTKWSNTLNQFGRLPTICLSIFDHFVGLVLKGLGLRLRKLVFVTVSIISISIYHISGFWEIFWQLADIKSKQDVLAGFLQHIGLLFKLAKLYQEGKSFSFAFSILTLKSFSRKLKFS